MSGDCVEKIFRLYNLYGKEDYLGESVTQTEHAIQCAMQAEGEGHSVPTILGAFLHDIGHLVGQDDGLKRMVTDNIVLGVSDHDVIGQNFLNKHGLSDEVTDFVKGHVDAKRYLTFKNPKYYENLSSASKMTLVHQGGPMTLEEAEIFENNPRFHAILCMRTWDEKAKDPECTMHPIERYKDMLKSYVTSL